MSLSTHLGSAECKPTCLSGLREKPPSHLRRGESARQMTARWQMTRTPAHLNKTRHCLQLWDASRKKKNNKKSARPALEDWFPSFYLIWAATTSLLGRKWNYELSETGDDVALLCFCDFASSPIVFLNKDERLCWLLAASPWHCLWLFCSLCVLLLGRGAHCSKLKKRPYILGKIHTIIFILGWISNMVEFVAPPSLAVSWLWSKVSSLWRLSPGHWKRTFFFLKGRLRWEFLLGMVMKHRGSTKTWLKSLRITDWPSDWRYTNSVA